MVKVLKKKIQIHYWYIGEYETGGDKCLIAHGIVTGHSKLTDAMRIHTSPVRRTCVDEAAGDLIVTTQNNVYHCLLQYCCFEKQDEYPDVIPDYERIKEKYAGKID